MEARSGEEFRDDVHKKLPPEIFASLTARSPLKTHRAFQAIAEAVVVGAELGVAIGRAGVGDGVLLPEQLQGHALELLVDNREVGRRVT